MKLKNKAAIQMRSEDKMGYRELCSYPLEADGNATTVGELLAAQNDAIQALQDRIAAQEAALQAATTKIDKLSTAVGKLTTVIKAYVNNNEGY